MSQYQIPLDRTANEPVSEGLHVFTIIDFKEGEGKAGPYWLFTCACQTPGESDKTATLMLSLSPQSRWKMELFLDAVGAPDKGNATAEKFLGRQFKGQVTHGEYNGRPQANINELFPVSKKDAAPKPAPVVVKSAEVVDTPSQAPEPKGLPKDVIEEETDDIQF